MGRQAALGTGIYVEPSAKTGFNVRIDPHALPQSFKYDTGLPGEAAEAAVVLDRALATVSRRLPSGIPMALRMPVEVFQGVAVRMVEANGDVAIVLELLHDDPLMSVPLMVTTEMDDVVADWRAWCKVLALPMLMVDPDGTIRQIEGRIGAVAVKPTCPRRRRTILGKRRPRFLTRRRVGGKLGPAIHAGEREITCYE